MNVGPIIEAVWFRRRRGKKAGIGAEAVIPSTRSRKTPIPHDPLIYKLRNRVERCFNKLKHFRRFATRFDRLAPHYLAFVNIAASMLWIR